MPRDSERILTEWLVLNALSGKTLALDQLFRIWYPKFLRYATRQLDDQEAARDVVQDALITMARSIRKLRDPAAFPRWAYQILHRRGIDYLRKAIRRREREVDTDDMDVPLGDRINEDETSRNVMDALNQLDTLNYSLLHLRYLHGFSVKEIATICDIPEGTAKSRLHAARGKIRELLEEDL